MTFRSGFLIFIKPFGIKPSFIKGKYKNENSSVISIFKNTLINNKLTLYSAKHLKNEYNMNSLKFLMIKLGVFYNEMNMLRDGIKDIHFFDMKTTNFLMDYILTTSQNPVVVSNINDNFFLYSIKLTIEFLISQIDKRAQNLKGDTTLNKIISVSSQFYDVYDKNNIFKEIIILTKYLDTLRSLNHSIFYDRKIINKSFKQLTDELYETQKKKNFDNENITYLTNELLNGNISKCENFIINKIKFSNNESFDLKLLKKIIIELYCYLILQKDEKLSHICIKILKNCDYNPNLFFRNICFRTQIKTLKRFLFEHLKHMKLTTENDEKLYNFMNYLDSNYSNPSFESEYVLKSTKILAGEEYKDNCNLNITYDYELIPDHSKSYKTFTNDINPKRISLTIDYMYYGNFSITKTFFIEIPLLVEENISLFSELISQSNNISKTFYSYETLNEKFEEVYEKFFFCSDSNDLCMEKTNLQNLNFLKSPLFSIVNELITNYFDDHELKFYFGDISQKSECVYCRDNYNLTQNDFLNDTKHLGYSNISIEHLKFFDSENFYRIKFQDFLSSLKGKEYSLDLYTNFSDGKISKEKDEAIYDYISSHSKIHLLESFVEEVSKPDNSHVNIDEDFTILTEYFTSKNKEYKKLKESSILALHLSLYNSNPIISDTMFNLFARKNILLISKESEINEVLIKKLIISDLLLLSNASKRISVSKLDKCFNDFIFSQENNYYLIQTLLDNHWYNPRIALSENSNQLDIWKKMIIFSKIKTKDFDSSCLYEMAIENLKAFDWNKNKKIGVDNLKLDYEELMILCCLLYLKENFFNSFENTIQKLKSDKSFSTKKSLLRVQSLIEEIFPKLPIKHKSKENFPKNTIITLNEDTDIHSLIDIFYPYLVKDNISLWNLRNEKSRTHYHIDNFEILIENGLAVESYKYYKENLQNRSQKEIISLLYTISFNNLLNFNIYATIVTLLFLFNKDDDTKELIVHVEAANRILSFEIEQMTVDPKIRKDLLNFIINKNSKLSDIKDNPLLLQVLFKYQELVEQFHDLKTTKNNSNKYDTLTADVVKRLEDAIWGAKESQDKIDDDSWHLISLFCKMNNYEMKLTYLHEFGRKNNWISFLDKGQEQDCSPTTIYSILMKYFDDEELKEHLSVALKNLIKDKEPITNKAKKRKKPKDQLAQQYNIEVPLFEIFFSRTEENKASRYFDPLCYLKNKEEKKERELLSEAIYYNWKDIILVSEIDSIKEDSFESFVVYLYISIKEYIIEGFECTEYVQLKELFDSKKKAIKISDFEVIIEFLIMNKFFNIIIDGIEVFKVPYSFEEFIYFTKAIFDDDFEEAYIHLGAYILLKKEEEEESLQEEKSFIIKECFEKISNSILKKFEETFKKEGKINRINKLEEILELVSYKKEDIS